MSLPRSSARNRPTLVGLLFLLADEVVRALETRIELPVASELLNGEKVAENLMSVGAK